MHQIARNCASSFKIFPGVTPPNLHTGEGDTPSPDLFPTRRFAPRLVASGHSIALPPESSILPSETNVWIKPWAYRSILTKLADDSISQIRQ